MSESTPTDREPSGQPMIETNRSAFAQILLCRGCCCGREDRGYAPVPVEKIKARWKELKLNRYVQLTVSGCLGPCDVSNVALIIAPERQIWLGGLQNDSEYKVLTRWAEACGEKKMFLPLPDSLAAKKLSRWPATKRVLVSHQKASNV